MGIGYGSGEMDQDEALRLHQSGEILPLSIILQKAQALQRGKLLETEIKRKDGMLIYELEIYGDDGKYYDLEFDARTGNFLKREVE